MRKKYRHKFQSLDKKYDNYWHAVHNFRINEWKSDLDLAKHYLK